MLFRGVVHEAFAHVMLVKVLDLALIDLEHDEVVKYRFTFLVNQHFDCALVVGQQLAGGGFKQAFMQALNLLHIVAYTHLCGTLAVDEFFHLPPVLTNEHSQRFPRELGV